MTILGGKVTARGWEASAAGNITKEWGLIASYTYVHARITKTTIPIQLNAEPLNTPTHAFSLWTTYDVTPQLQVGGGAFYTARLLERSADDRPARQYRAGAGLVAVRRRWPPTSSRRRSRCSSTSTT